jgi:hypothetical protein
MLIIIIEKQKVRPNVMEDFNGRPSDIYNNSRNNNICSNANNSNNTGYIRK